MWLRRRQLWVAGSVFSMRENVPSGSSLTQGLANVRLQLFMTVPQGKGRIIFQFELLKKKANESRGTQDPPPCLIVAHFRVTM